MSGPAFLFDTNLWLALTFVRHPFHSAARAVYVSATADRPAAFCRATQNSFLRLLTAPAMVRPFGTALTNHDAVEQLGDYLSKPHVVFLDEPTDVYPAWVQFATLPTASPKRWMDAYLAAFALRGQLQLVTTDKDFASFAGLNRLVLPAPTTAAPEAGSTV